MRKRIAETIYGRVNQTTGTKGFRTLANVSLTNAAISLFVTNKSTDKTTLLAAINLDHNSGKCRDIDLFFRLGWRCEILPFKEKKHSVQFKEIVNCEYVHRQCTLYYILSHVEIFN